MYQQLTITKHDDHEVEIQLTLSADLLYRLREHVAVIDLAFDDVESNDIDGGQQLEYLLGKIFEIDV